MLLFVYASVGWTTTMKGDVKKIFFFYFGLCPSNSYRKWEVIKGNEHSSVKI